MADGVVAAAVEKLGVLLLQEATLVGGVRSEIEWLRSELRRMECFLKDADSKRRKGDERMKNWVKDVREVAQQSEDVVDTFLLHTESRAGTLPEFFRRYFCFPCEIVHLHDIGNEILQIKSKIDNIRESRDAYGIVNLGEGRQESSIELDEKLQAMRQLSPHLDDDAIVVGFDAHKMFVLELLLNTDVLRRCVISVVGMGGLGKTTLATVVYNSNEVESHFSVCAWVTVSQDYRVSELLRRITKKVTGAVFTKEHSERLERMDAEELKSNLYEFLKHSRYLIVLDDIWAQELWERIKSAFPNAMNGSRVLLTTRIMDVARSADPSIPPYELPFLNQQQSWELFLNKAFPSGRNNVSTCPDELEKLGQELVKRCGGLPLALVVLGGLLSRKNPTYNAWLEVAENMDWESTVDGKQCLQILALSYNHLPSHNLKSCFLYLGSFPEDYQIKASELIKMWIAEGFIPQNERQTLEQTANGYMDELIQRCMVQAVDRSVTTARAKNIQIHDLVHDLCISEAKEDGFFRIYNNNLDNHDIVSSRRLVIFNEVFSDKLCNSEYRARTLLGFSSMDFKVLNSILHGFKLLRVIHLHCPVEVEFHKSKLPKEIGGLVHLRHIKLRTLSLWYLPSSIGKLRNLQTLDVKRTGIMTLPKTLYQIQTLRHVYTKYAFTVESSSVIANLRGLQTLKIVRAGSWIRRDLAMLSNLRNLAISEVSVTDTTVLAHSLPKLNHLTSLKLLARQSVTAASLFTSFQSCQHLRKLTLHGLWTCIHQLPNNLITLSLIGCKLDRDAITSLGELQCLVCLKLEACQLVEDEMVCSEGGFPRLQNLQVDGLNELKYWRIESGALPNLVYLKIKNCLGLMMLPEGLEHATSLQKLEMKGFQPIIMTRLNSTGDDRHKIQHIPSFWIDPTVGE